MPEQQRSVVRHVRFRADALDAFAAACDEIGLSQTEAASRLLEWFSQQPMEVRQLVVRTLAADRAEPVAKEMARVAVRMRGLPTISRRRGRPPKNRSTFPSWMSRVRVPPPAFQRE